eukprot:Phypoly_transcript_10179.p1 GENE.Phypoly_transcript_10179~~Phypoly_transcript_10179.p1  ORF type:complete len:222 (+),score=6.52 Phypoly_transcript_10179:249-914(+)
MRTSSGGAGDEEFARKLHEAGTGAAVITDDEDEYGGRRGSLHENDKDDMIDHEPPSSMSQEQVRLISIQRIAFLIKMICTLDFLFSIYSYVVRAVWLMGSLGFLMNPIAFYGAHTYRRRLILLYCGYLVVDTIFQFVYLFVNKEDKQTYVHTITILLCIFFIMTKGYIVYYVYSFYKILPSQGIFPFLRLALFFSFFPFCFSFLLVDFILFLFFLFFFICL